MTIADLEARAKLYAVQRGRAIEKLLGHGSDGAVWQTSRATAVKVCEDAKRYFTERDCYRLLLDEGITEIYGFTIPTLIDYSDSLMAIEMAIVQPPYLIDFGKAYLHISPPQFSRETMADWYAEKKELYGEHWPTILKILRRLQSLGIHHMDPKPSNILPANWNPSLD